MRERFNPRLRAGGDAGVAALVLPASVSIHASAREATKRGLPKDAPVTVSIHASAREATILPVADLTDDEFQSTPPRGRRQQLLAHRRWSRRFNPRLRAGGDHHNLATGAVLPVSIHASAREATSPCSRRSLCSPSFNPRLRAGGDVAHEAPVRLCDRLNPRLRAGGDVHRAADAGGKRLVSIHASAREATAEGGDREPVRIRFNPRLRAGGDQGYSTASGRHAGFNPRLRAGGDSRRCVASACASWFQSTPPRGRRPGRARDLRVAGSVSIHASAREATPTRLTRTSLPICFNPRLRAGGDRGYVYREGKFIVSIHASAREATVLDRHDGASRVVSIHASAREATVASAICTVGATVSIHASAREATSRRSPLTCDGDGFQSTPPRGRRRARSWLRGLVNGVSIHASAREATRVRRHRNAGPPRFNPRLRAGGDGGDGAMRSVGRCFNPRLRAGGDDRVLHAWTPGTCFNPRLRAGGDADN